MPVALSLKQVSSLAPLSWQLCPSDSLSLSNQYKLKIQPLLGVLLLLLLLTKLSAPCGKRARALLRSCHRSKAARSVFVQAEEMQLGEGAAAKLPCCALHDAAKW
jgi:hypothetical protein